MESGWSLVRLLATNRHVHSKGHRPPLLIPDILHWADAYHDRHGVWPNAQSGPIPEAPGNTWRAVSNALFSGLRGLTGDTSLARLLQKERGVSHLHDVVPFTIEGILAWADAHHARTATWPNSDSGPIPESPGDNWCKVNDALRRGHHGMKGNSSLAQASS